MALLKRKPETSKVLSVRIPQSAHQEFDELQALADAKGFDLRGSLTDAVLQWIRQARRELGGSAGETEGLSVHKARSMTVNGSGERG